MEYDPKDRTSILTYAQRLEHSSITETNTKYKTFGGTSIDQDSVMEKRNFYGKGSFGSVLEEQYFGKKIDSISQPDFPEAKLELKSSPLKILKNSEVRVKERLVLNHFRYCDIDKETFETSAFANKNLSILLVFYFHDASTISEQLKIDLVDVWNCLQSDEAQIREDWKTIVAKVHAGKAEEISEGDTLYLGACTKGADAQSSMQNQPHSEVMAKGRALCFKQSYINHIYKVLKEQQSGRPLSEQRFTNAAMQSLADHVKALFQPYMGMTLTQISQLLETTWNGKSKYALMARHILGFRRGSSFYEFEAADIQVKTIRVEPNGKIKESMSFKPIKYCEIVDQVWEDSDFYQELISKFIFVIFRRNQDEQEYRLHDVKLWNMPEKDIEIVKQVWEQAKQHILEDDFQHFVRLTDNLISHVRPHAKNKDDLMDTPSGRKEYKRSFWLNKSYIQREITDK